jgi:hypothetical protein
MVERWIALCDSLRVLYLLFHYRGLGVVAGMKRTFKLSDQESHHLISVMQLDAMKGDKQSIDLFQELMKQYNQCEEPCDPCGCSDCPVDTPAAHKHNDCVHSHLENDSCVLFPIPICDPMGKGCYLPVSMREKLLVEYEAPPNLEKVDLGAMIGEFDRRGLVVKVRDKK